jgi:hypothetical protein
MNPRGEAGNHEARVESELDGIFALMAQKGVRALLFANDPTGSHNACAPHLKHMVRASKITLQSLLQCSIGDRWNTLSL